MTGGLAVLAVVLLGAGCTEACNAQGVACAADAADLTGTAVSGVVAGAAVTLGDSGWSPDATCGPRGRILRLSAGVACGSGDGGAPAQLSIYLSDLRPGVYAFTGAVSCQSVPGGRGFFADLHDGGGDRAAVAGAVTFDGGDPVARGSVDVQFEGDQHLRGHFTASACGS